MPARGDGRKVLVTGGAGFIGQHLVRALRGRNLGVRVLDNLTNGSAEGLPPEVELVVGDILDGEFVREAIREVEVVFHLAAIASVSESTRHRRRAHAVNFGGAREVFEAAARAAGPRVVFASSAAVYGEPDRLPLREDSPTAPVSEYGADKLACERHALALAASAGLRWLGLRLFNVYGPGQDPASPYSGVITNFLERTRAGQESQIFGNGEQTRDFVFVDDVIACFLWAMGRDDLRSEVFNVSTGEATSVNQLAELILRLRPGAPPPVHSPPRRGDVRRSVGASAKLARFGGPLPKTTLRQGLSTMLSEPQA